MFGRELFYDSAGLKPGIIFGAGDFQLNGVSQPSALTTQWARGSFGMPAGALSAATSFPFSVNRTGVGVYVVTMASFFTFVQPPVIEASNTFVTTSFWANVSYATGGWTNAARQFTINLWTNLGAAVDPPADAGNRASFYIEGLDCSGRG